jgi:predicted PurR-regulated permease PerM
MNNGKIFPSKTRKAVTIIGVVLLSVIFVLYLANFISTLIAGFFIAVVVAVFLMMVNRETEKKSKIKGNLEFFALFLLLSRTFNFIDRL